MAEPLKNETIDAALEGMAQVLNRQNLAHPVRLQFPNPPGPPLCWEWRCRDEGGVQVCGWVKVPC